MYRDIFEERYGKYRKHPKAVQSGFDGLPILESGKFYIIYQQNDATSSGHGTHLPARLVYISSKPEFHGEYKVSYVTLSFGVQKAGCMGYGFIYLWFGKGLNCIVELPEDQQKLYKNLMKGIDSQAGCAYRHKIGFSYN